MDNFFEIMVDKSTNNLLFLECASEVLYKVINTFNILLYLIS